MLGECATSGGGDDPAAFDDVSNYPHLKASVNPPPPPPPPPPSPLSNHWFSVGKKVRAHGLTRQHRKLDK
eukprot:474220-Hanusia_phi.AAC.1